MQLKPHKYQQFTIDFIENHPQAAIFLGMGLGKTIITLTAINNLIYDQAAVKKALIIAPLRVARDTWKQELSKWDHLTNLRMSVIVGTAKDRQQALNKDADVYVINRENVPWLVQELKHWPFDMVVIDELSSFKNHKAKRFKALKSRRKWIKRIVGLTGTPAPNSLEDLWAPFRLIDEGKRLGKYLTHFRNDYFVPDKRNGHQIFSWKLKPGAETAIYDNIRDITVSMRTTDYLELPPLTVTTRTAKLNRKSQVVYQQLQRDLITSIEGSTIDAGTAGALANKLLQLSSGAIYDEEGRVINVHSHKLDVLEDLVEAADGDTILVAYWFKHELERLQQKFPQGQVLSTSEDMSNWNRGKIPLAFIHPASAGHGLNLQSGGHNLVWLTTPWSLELYEQTNARLFRQGQTQPVSIVHIELENTIDQQVIQSLRRKDTTQSALVDAVAAHVQKSERKTG